MNERRPSVVLVTGGAGFVGSSIVRRLCRRGDEVHVLVRPSTQRAALAGLALGWHQGDLEQPESVRRALAAAARSAAALGRELDVVHCAARISYRRVDVELLRRTNVAGTETVLEACRAVRVRRLCHVSSVVALGPVASPEAFLDDDAPLGGLELDSAYARTKAEAEVRVLAASRELDAVVASPAVVFGAASQGSNSLHFLARVARGRIGPLSPPGSLSVVGLEDAARGIVAVLDSGKRARRYLLAESSWRLHDLFHLACRLVGRRGPRGTVPAAAWSVGVRALGAWDRFFPAERATPEALRLLGLHFRFQARRARAELGWSPVPCERVLAETLDWMSRAGPAGVRG